MQLIGDNSAYGAQRVELSEDRAVLPAVAEGDSLPYDVCGLIPVVTKRKAGKSGKPANDKLVYALPCNGSADPNDAIANAPSKDAACAIDVLTQAVDLFNDLLDKAACRAQHDFGYIDQVQVGIKPEGWGFSRVESLKDVVYDRPKGKIKPGTHPAPIPLMRLRVETVEHPGQEFSLSASVEYDKDGYPVVVNMVEYGEDGWICRVNADTDNPSSRLELKKVEEAPSISAPGKIIYHRNWRHDPYRPHW